MNGNYVPESYYSEYVQDSVRLPGYVVLEVRLGNYDTNSQNGVRK